MLFSLIVALGALQVSTAPTQEEEAAPIVQRDFTYRLKTPVKIAEPATLATSNNVVKLKNTKSKSKSSQALEDSIRLKNGTTNLQSTHTGASYAIDIDFGKQSFTVSFDTGSSDLWIPRSNFKCVNYYERPFPQSDCAFGPLYKGAFEEGRIKNTNFNISYGDGEFLTGDFGYQDVTIAGITVTHQESALVDYAYWVGDNETSGLIGFAYPSLTSAFPGNDPSKDDYDDTDVYPNWITNAIKRNLIADSLFSVVIERGSNGGGGYLALGGLPPIKFKHDFTSTPIKILELVPGSPKIQSKQFSYYTIIPDGFIVKARGTSEYYGFPAPQADGDIDTNFPAIIDTGTTLNYLPPRLVERIAALFDPPAIYLQQVGLFEALCDAVPPEVGVTINGTDFMMSSHDVLLRGDLGYDPSTGLCVMGFQPSSGPYILGDVFLKNVVAVFDIGASEMHFAPHVNYTD